MAGSSKVAGPSKSIQSKANSRLRISKPEWASLASILDKINGLKAEAERRLTKSCPVLLNSTYMQKVLEECDPANFDVITQEDLHNMHQIEPKNVGKGKKRKREDDHDETCPGCHEMISTLFLSWITQAREKIVRDHDSEKAKKKRKVKHYVRILQPETPPSTPPKKKAKKYKEDLTGIECEICCSENIKLESLTFCTEGHLFCVDCARIMAENVIGLQKTNLCCMSMDGCDAVFHESQVKRFLPEKTYNLWMRMKTTEEIQAANIPGMQMCPFCDYAYVAEDPLPLFTCAGKDCGIVSCSTCKRKDHRPQTCADLDRESRMTDQQKAEEKMAEAIIRRCPRPGCNAPIIKDETTQSCNMMYCPKCSCPMCYICRVDVTKERYEHFERKMPQGDKTDKAATKPCPLYDNTLKRHETELKNIRKSLGLNARSKPKAKKEGKATPKLAKRGVRVGA
ncbi:uncharacterized protein FA14DRAFT_160217 [Meira miltonrushii]|uniref:RING-type domain-containing protein n=1 Tax=Meira miltonrushii TaxID=1280837 RepID=A0A316VB77_9BASI|nr:uncharacterized protein FA14DRAFT_160217 [Meira miltonrushii]PWN34740.1 hypothetical protein FA14DRAFT_160217 [Meira miltonrushii]